jgi:hypothetical protein
VIPRSAPLLIGLVLVAVACQRKAPDAVVREVNGTVSIRKAGEGAPIDALVGSALVDRDQITTGPDSRARVEFSGGNIVELDPNTTLAIRRGGGGTKAEFGAFVLEGHIRVESGKSGVLLSVGTPFGQTEIGAQELVVEVDLQSGVQVLVGQVTVVGDDGTRTVVTAGNAMQVDGLLVPITGTGVTTGDVNVTLQPISFILLANPKHVQVRRKDTTAWVTPKKRDVLEGGDAVRTRKASGTQVQFGDGSGVTLQQSSQVLFEEVSEGGKEKRARYTLEVGAATLHLTRESGGTSQHEVQVAGLKVGVRPGDREADVEISVNEKGRAQLLVRFGRVLLSDGTEIDAGSSVTIENGKVVSEVGPLAPTDVELRTGVASLLYFQNEIPPVAFNWRGDTSFGSYQIEVATDKDFNQTVFKETVKKASFVYDSFRPGKYHWRVKSGDQWSKGSIVIQKGGENDCANCKRVNEIQDTGVKAVVYFQKALPAITLAWKPVAGASQYAIKVFRDGEFENALIEKTVAETKYAFPAGTFEEGKYFWFVKSLNSAGKEVATGGTNGLEIVYDNVVSDIVIRSPRPNQRVASGRLTTNGEIALGARLFINGKQADIDRKGRFNESVTLDRGVSQLVYRTLAGDGVERYYVRDVQRR